MFLSRIKVFVSDIRVWTVLSLSALLQIAIWVYVLNYWRAGSGSIILHYNIEFGVDLVGPWYYILSLPLSGLIFLLLDFGLAFFLFLRFRSLSYILIFTALAVQIILFIATLLIFFLNS
jgi:hypothetical protein